MPVSCHVRDCKALLATSLTCAKSAIASIRFCFYLSFTFLYLYDWLRMMTEPVTFIALSCSQSQNSSIQRQPTVDEADASYQDMVDLNVTSLWRHCDKEQYSQQQLFDQLASLFTIPSRFGLFTNQIAVYMVFLIIQWNMQANVRHQWSI